MFYYQVKSFVKNNVYDRFGYDKELSNFITKELLAIYTATGSQGAVVRSVESVCEIKDGEKAKSCVLQLSNIAESTNSGEKVILAASMLAENKGVVCNTQTFSRLFRPA